MEESILKVRILSFQPCTENLYLTLFREFRETLIPVVVNLVQGMQGDCNPDDINSLLQKDAGITIPMLILHERKKIMHSTATTMSLPHFTLVTVTRGLLISFFFNFTNFGL